VSCTVSRRELLKLIALRLAAVPLALSVGCTPRPPRGWGSLALRASTWFHPQDLGTARLIGARVLTQVGREHRALQAELGGTIELLKAASPADDPTVFEAAIAQDFRALAVRDVEGWTLAATEAHLAALVELFGIAA
jgi:hypothetical protein